MRHFDQPALARQTELAGTTQPRPGTLSSRHLQSLYGQRAQLTNTLDRIDSNLAELPHELNRANMFLTMAQDKLENARTRLQGAFDTIEIHDRPFRRRGHETDIAAARRTIETLPNKMRDSSSHVDTHTTTVAGLETKLAATQKLDQTRPTVNHHLRDIDHTLNDDRRIRTRTIRRDPPERITDTIGARPQTGEPARAWDIAAGQLDQHQTTYNIPNGYGPDHRPGAPPGQNHSRNLAQNAANQVERIITQQERPERDHHGPAMRIT